VSYPHSTLESTITDYVDSCDRKIKLKARSRPRFSHSGRRSLPQVFRGLIPHYQEVEMLPNVGTRSAFIPGNLLEPSNPVDDDYPQSENASPRTTFSSLPPELRFQIWEETFPEPRWLHRLPLPPPPIALSICQESRLVALEKFATLSNKPYSYIKWSTDTIDADFLAGVEFSFSESDINKIKNIAIRRFDPESSYPGTIWQRNLRFKEWPLCSFRFNCSDSPWGSQGLSGWVLDQGKLKSLKTCHLIVPAKDQLVFLEGKIIGYDEVLVTMRADKAASQRIISGMTRAHAMRRHTQRLGSLERWLELKALASWKFGQRIVTWALDKRGPRMHHQRSTHCRRRYAYR
jgi:hypothetical protein